MQEIVYWYELRKKLEDARYEELFRSWRYWLIVICFMLGSGIFTWIWYGAEPSGQMSREPREYLLVGAATPLLFKKLVASFGSKGLLKLGPKRKTIWKDYFQIS